MQTATKNLIETYKNEISFLEEGLAISKKNAIGLVTEFLVAEQDIETAILKNFADVLIYNQEDCKVGIKIHNSYGSETTVTIEFSNPKNNSGFRSLDISLYFKDGKCVGLNHSSLSCSVTDKFYLNRLYRKMISL